MTEAKTINSPLDSDLKQDIQEEILEGKQLLGGGEMAVDAVVKAGSLLMKAGAEVYRVEDTMQALGNSIPQVSECIPYVTSTGVMCSLVYEGVTFTRIARIKDQSRNISIINAVNHLSRQSVKYHYSSMELEEKLDKISELPIYPTWAKGLFGAIGAMGFAIFFGGNLWDVIATFFIGLFIRFGDAWMDRIEINDFLSTAFLSVIAGGFSVLVAHYFSATSQDTLIISSIMLLVPGLAIMNAIRDIMMGEYISGTASLMQALFVAAAIAIGIALSLYLAQYLTELRVG